MTKITPHFPALAHTAPEWSRRYFRGSLSPSSGNIEDGFFNPIETATRKAIDDPLPKRSTPLERFVKNHVYDVLFTLQCSEMREKDFKNLRNLSLKLPNEVPFRSEWEAAVDKIKQKLSEPELRDYSNLDKFRITILLLNDLWFSKHGTMIFRNTSHFDDTMEFFNNLDTVTTREEFHFAPGQRPMNSYLVDGVQMTAHQQATKYDAAGTSFTNLNILSYLADSIFQGGIDVPQYMANTLKQQGMSIDVARACAHAERDIKDRYGRASNFLPVSVQDSFLTDLTCAVLHADLERDHGDQLIEFNPAFYRRFAETKLNDNGLLKEAYARLLESETGRQLSPILEYTTFDIATLLKRGEYSKDPKTVVVDWLQQSVLFPNSPRGFNMLPSFSANVGLRLLADELDITENSITPDNVSKFEKTELAEQGIALINTHPAALSRAMEKVYEREFTPEVIVDNFQSYS